MIKVENIDVWGFEHAIRGMRNPRNSWSKSDSRYCAEHYITPGGCPDCPLELEPPACDFVSEYIIGPNDMDLMRKLYNAGTEHRKYLRQIFVSMDVTAPLYWWKEMDTYKFALPDPLHHDSDSCSTMHMIAAKEFELDDFSHEHLLPISESVLDTIIRELNSYRELYLTHKYKEHWWQLIQLLPSSYNQKRTITTNYENVAAIIHQRLGHPLDEWNKFIDELLGLPYIKDIIGWNDEK